MPRKSDKTIYDCIIVGAGPAGIFAALQIVGRDEKIKVLLLEKGKSLKQRACPSQNGKISCLQCQPCNIMAGWGGAGAFSDGKLNLGKQMGGWLNQYLSQKTYEKYLAKTDGLWLKFGAPEKLYGVNGQTEKLKNKFEKAGFRTIIGPTRHLGTEGSVKVLQNMHDFLQDKIEIKFNAEVAKIKVEKKQAVGVIMRNGEEIAAKKIIAAPGREGCNWFFHQAHDLGLKMTNHPVMLGVRVETKASVMKHLTDYLYEAKLFYRAPTFEDEVRTFCMCPNGEVVQEQYSGFKGIISVNGHAYTDKKTKNTNFALLVTTDFTEPFHEPIVYGENITRLANLLGKTVIVQRLGDLLAGRRSTPARIKKGKIRPTLTTATPGDLSAVLPYRHMTNILEMIKQMDKVAPGIFSFDTLLYGVEVKFYSSAPKLNKNLETEIKNLYAVGDGAGVTRNLTHACISGMIAGKAVCSAI